MKRWLGFAVSILLGCAEAWWEASWHVQYLADTPLGYEHLLAGAYKSTMGFLLLWSLMMWGYSFPRTVVRIAYELSWAILGFTSCASILFWTVTVTDADVHMAITGNVIMGTSFLFAVFLIENVEPRIWRKNWERIPA